VYALAFDPVAGPAAPPRHLLSASQDATVRLWSLDTYTNLVVYRGHREPVWDVQWGPRGIYFATASRDRTARLWTTDKTSAIRIFAGHLSDVNCVTFHPNSLYLATGSADRTCRLWDVQKGVCVRVFVGHRGSVNKVAISPDGRWLASAAEDATISLWDIGLGKRMKTFTGHSAAVHSLSFSAESSVLVSGGADATVRVWDVLAAPPPEGVAAGGAAAPGSKLAIGLSVDPAKRRQSAVGGAGGDDKALGKKDGKERYVRRSPPVVLYGQSLTAVFDCPLPAAPTCLRRSRPSARPCLTCTSRRGTWFWPAGRCRTLESLGGLSCFVFFAQFLQKVRGSLLKISTPLCARQRSGDPVYRTVARCARGQRGCGAGVGGARGGGEGRMGGGCGSEGRKG